MPKNRQGRQIRENRCSGNLNDYFIDTLTGLYSHTFFQEALSREIERTKASHLPLSLALLNLDYFSSFNAEQGYFAGDDLLAGIADFIRKEGRESDLACRIREDEFALVLPKTTPQEALLFTNSIRLKANQMILQSFPSSNHHSVTLSAGISCAPQDSHTASDLLSKARQALSRAKLQGKNQALLYTPPDQQAQTDQAVILMVDDVNSNLDLIEHTLSSEPYIFLRANDGLEALSIIKRQKPDLILLDIMMPNLDGFQVCRRLKDDDNTRLIPIILITSLDTLNDQITGIEAGADDYLRKPFEKMELIARVRSLLRAKHLNDNLENLENIIFSLAKAVEAKDKYTLGHTERVTYYSFLLGHHLDLRESEIKALKYGSALHDIGKIAVPDAVLNKSAPLTQQEWEIIKMHPQAGYEICLPLQQRLGEALKIIRSHHEKLNGSGYPDGLSGENVPLLARIMSIADIYDALTVDRSYRKHLSMNEAMIILKKEANQGLLDRKLIICFEKIMAK